MTSQEVEVDLEAGGPTAGVSSNGVVALPNLVTVTVTKSTRDALVGLGVTDKLGSYGKAVPVINSIKEGSLCSGTALQVGMHLYKINGVACKSKDDATAMLKVSEGSIAIVAGPPGLVWATVSKASKDTKVGLHMERYKNSDKVFIGNVKGLFAATDLKPNMTILQINDKDVTGVPMPEVLEMVSEAESKITILAQAPLDVGQKLLSHPPPEGLAGGEWGTTTYVGSMTGALAIAAIITGVGWFFILLFCPCDKIDVYKLNDKLFTPNGEFYKSATRRNFEIRKSEHVTEKVNGVWGTTTYVGPLTWSCAIVAAPTIIGFFLILLFFPMDERDVYYSNGKLYTADGFFYKSATEKNFQLTKSQHLKL